MKNQKTPWWGLVLSSLLFLALPFSAMAQEESSPVDEGQVSTDYYAPLSTILITPLETEVYPGDKIRVIAKAKYHEDRESQNITSCFNCPTANNSSTGH